jgi:hypothetical protein
MSEVILCILIELDVFIGLRLAINYELFSAQGMLFG